MSDSPRISPGATDAREPSGWAPESLFDGRFQVVRELGRGGMGAVFIVFDREICRELALKRMLPGGVGDLAYEERFRREYRALASIAHPGVPQVHHSGRAPDGSPWFTMELVRGDSLRAVLDRGRLSPAQALDVAIDLGKILAAAHEAGVIHRDVKPGNIMLEPGGRVRLLDFGVCTPLGRFLRHAERRRRTAHVDRWQSQEANFAGTIGYSDPATHDGSPATVRSDIFSVAAILYEMLAGRRLFDVDGGCYRAIDSAEFPATLAPLALVLGKATAPNPFERPRSMTDLVQRLEIARGHMLRLEYESRVARLRALTVALALVSIVALVWALGSALRPGGSSEAAPGGEVGRSSAVVGPAAIDGAADEPGAPVDVAAGSERAPSDATQGAAPASERAQGDATRGAGSTSERAQGDAARARRPPDVPRRPRGRLTARTPQVQACVDRYGAPDGELAVDLAVGADGRVGAVTLVALGWPLLARCVQHALSDMSLPPGRPGPRRLTFTVHEPRP